MIDPTHNNFISHAENVLHKTTGYTGTRFPDTHKKAKDLLKFGARLALPNGIKTTIADFEGGNNEVYASSNSVDKIVSSDPGDTGTVVVEGHELTSNGLEFKIQTVTLTGTTPADLVTPLIRCTRIYAVSQNLIGKISVYDSVISAGAVDSNSVKCQVIAGNNQSNKAATAISYADALFITSVTLSTTRSSGGTVSVDFDLERKPYDSNVWRPFGLSITLKADVQSSLPLKFEPYLIVESNSDVRITATASNTGANVAAHWQSMLTLTRY